MFVVVAWVGFVVVGVGVAWWVEWMFAWLIFFFFVVACSSLPLIYYFIMIFVLFYCVES